MFKRASYIFAAGLLLAVINPASVALATIYSAGSLLQTGDVKSVHILDGTILDQDVNGDAKISGRKIAPGGVGGEVLLAGGDRIASSTSLKFATSTSVLTIGGGTISQASSTVVGQATVTGGILSQASSTVVGNFTVTGTCSGCGGSSLTSSFTTGMALLAGTPVAIGDGGTEVFTANPANQSTTQSVGQAGTVQQMGLVVYIKAPALASATWLVQIKKTGSPADTLNFFLEKDSGGFPDGTVVAATSTLASNLTGSFATTTITFPAVYFNGATKYWLVMSRSGGTDGANYYTFPADSVASTTAEVIYNGTTWSNNGSITQFTFTGQNYTAGTVFQASASTTISSNNFIGLAAAAAATSSSVSIVVDGIATGLSGLSTGVQYLIGPTLGALTTAAGSITENACIALSSSTCLLDNSY